MPNAIRLLEQIQTGLATLGAETTQTANKVLLADLNVAVNELILQSTPGFYTRYIERGRALVTQGLALLKEPDQRILTSIQSLIRSDLSPAPRAELLEQEIEALHRVLGRIVLLLDDETDAHTREYVVRLGRWESSLYLHRMTDTDPAASIRGRQSISPTALKTYLETRFPTWTHLRVISFTELSGGFSKHTVLFDTQDALNGYQSLVMRAETPARLLCVEGSKVDKEFQMIQLMRNAGLPTAEPQWLEADENLLGARFIVSRKANGSNAGGNLGSRDQLSTKLVHSILDTFIQMHRIAIDRNDPLARTSHLREWLGFDRVGDATRYCVTDYMNRMIQESEIDVPPLLQLGLKWLRRNIPEVEEPPAVLHIDFALNNLLIDMDQVTAVLDWESSRLGDPAEDIIWTQQNLAAYITMPEFLARYEAGTGRRVSAFRLAYFRVAKCALNSITCARALKLIDTSDAAKINLCLLGLKYMGQFGTKFEQLIAEAEALL